jgi:predicted RNase H-like HicB family nuclease
MSSDQSKTAVGQKGSRQYNYTVLLQPVPEGGYNVFVPAIPEICTFGKTLEAAREMAQDAIRCFLESALETGEPIPPDVEPATERVAVALP